VGWREAELEEALRGGTDAEAIAAARRLVAALPADDPLRGRLAVRTARAMIQNTRRTQEAMPLLLAVARGEVAATDEDRREARWLAADALHYFDFKPLEAYAAYDEILDREGRTDPAVRARALVEVAACLLELAQMQQAYYNEVRRVCDQVRETVPPQYTRAHAVADLLHGESYLHEGDKEAALAALRGFAERHPGRARETAMANHVQGWLLAETGRWQEAVVFFERNLELPLDDPSESFYWRGERWNMRRLSAKWLLHYAGRFGDAERQRAYAEYVDQGLHEAGVAEVDPRAFDTAFPHSFYEWTEDPPAQE
jgi:tetratricopeptide (TPR) repeat protein